MIKTFSVSIPQQDLDNLRLKLQLTRWPDTPTGGNRNDGIHLDYMQELADYWEKHFDWRKVEAEINRYPNFMASIEGFDIHFLHIRSKKSNPIPLLITHGWPGSFLEMMKIIPLLTEDENLSFNLVIPSVPGFGFSGKPVGQGCNSSMIADLWHRLMIRLGYERYGAQGGDIGSGISTWLSLHYPENIIGLHLNYISASYKPYIPKGETLSDEVLAFQKHAAVWSSKEGAYAHLHATKPLTAAYGLNDSPVGLCAWIVEKFIGWSDNKGNIEKVFSKDELLANITLYWLTRSIYSSMRIYWENSLRPMVFSEGESVKVPVAFAKFPKELPTPPRSYIEKGFNIRRWTEMPEGGHFAAVEQPVLLANDIRAFFSTLR